MPFDSFAHSAKLFFLFSKPPHQRFWCGGKSRKLKSRGAYIRERAEVAARIFGSADGAAVINEPVGGDKPVFFWQKPHEVLLDAYGIARGGEAKASCKAMS